MSDAAAVAEQLHERLQERLDAAFAPVARKRVVVACRTPGRSTYAAVSSEPEACGDPAARPFPTGCLTKLLTGALLRAEIRAGRIGLDDPVVELLDDVEGLHALEGTTVRDLLEHTHGLDDSAVAHAPLRANGRIDTGTLLHALAPMRIFAPGVLYSYSNAGAWIIAAILERRHRTPISQQLRDSLFAPLGMSLPQHSPSLVPALRDGICASMGATLAITPRDMLAFLETEVLMRPEEWPRGAEEAQIRRLPGWNALERGILHGWKHHGEHWFGHNSAWPQASAMVRVEPRLGVSIVIASQYHPAAVVAGKLFASALPEYRNLSFPKPVTADVAATMDISAHCGRYHSAAEVLNVECAGNRELHFVARDVEGALIPAAHETFFLRPARTGRFTFVQFLDRHPEGFRYLWDGRRVYPRCRDAGF